MYHKIVAKEKDVFVTPLFICSIALPLITAIGVGLGLYLSPNFTQFLSAIWATMKLPIAIASLSIPLATWVIANHRSAQMVKSNRLQEEKRLIETYLEQERFFERVYGRKITTAKWSFITPEDLPVIHAELYEFPKLQEKGAIKVKEDIQQYVENYFKQTSRLFWEFYEHFVNEKENENNEFLLQSFTNQLFTYLYHQLSQFSNIFGTRSIDVNNTSLSTYVAAYFEIYELCNYLHIKNTVVDEESLSDDYETFIAVATLISQHFGLREDNATLGRFTQEMEMKQTVKFVTSKPHIQTINRLINEWAERFPEQIEGLKTIFVDGEYLSFKLFTDNHEDFIMISFVETEEQDYFGEIQFTKAEQKEFMPIYKSESGITLNNDAASAEEKIADIIQFILTNLTFPEKA